MTAMAAIFGIPQAVLESHVDGWLGVAEKCADCRHKGECRATLAKGPEATGEETGYARMPGTTPTCRPRCTADHPFAPPQRPLVCPRQTGGQGHDDPYRRETGRHCRDRLLPETPTGRGGRPRRFWKIPAVSTRCGDAGVHRHMERPPVTIHGSGMGMPSLSIYVNEMIRDYGAKTLIRIGSAGGMQPRSRCGMWFWR